MRFFLILLTLSDLLQFAVGSFLRQNYYDSTINQDEIPTYSQLLDTNQELYSELQDEIFINKSNEKKIRILVKEFEQCY